MNFRLGFRGAAMDSIATMLLGGLLLTIFALGISPLIAPPSTLVAIRFARGWTTFACTLLWGIAIGLLLLVPFSGPSSISLAPGLAFAVDATAALMLGIVTTVGWAANRFANRYVRGEPYEARYWRWSGTTLGMVATMIVSGNLGLFLGAWIGTSGSLHQLLLLEHERPGARKAAWVKFTISRIGDLALLVAVILIYRHYGTVEFAALAEAVQSLDSPQAYNPTIAWLIVVGAMTKSAQIPFHFWLPETLETPTPVSALMHAGIINAGGYLVLKTFPLISDVPSARVLLISIGTFTACLAAMIMLTQTSIKRSLAYSTIAQMGFMMLQCGLGAYAAAMLHIMAHSAYKAHAFLNSGTVPQTHFPRAVPYEASGMSVDRSRPLRLAGLSWLSRFPRTFATITAMLAYGAPLLAWQINPIEKTGGFVLGALFSIGIGHWLAGVFVTASRRVVLRAVGLVLLMGLFATSALQCIQLAMAPAFPYPIAPIPMSLALPIASLFLVPLVFESLAAHGRHPRFASRLYVGALNGFYLDAWGRRLGRFLQRMVAPHKSPVTGPQEGSL